MAKANDFSQTFVVRTHLGYILNAGDHCKGYLLANSNFNNTNFDLMEQSGRRGQIPDVVLVRKSYPNARKKQRSRNWKLKSMAKQEEEESNRKVDKSRAEQDYELFLRDLEEDPELRGMVNLYKGCVFNLAPDQPEPQDGDEFMEASDEEPEADFPEIDIDDLLDDVEQMTLDDME